MKVEDEARIKLQRTELFEMVWKEPLTKVAARLGVSNVGLAKACRRYNIPVPPRGYWAKLQHGKRVRRIAALPTAPGGNEDVRIARPARPAPVERLPNDIAIIVNGLTAEEKPLAIPANLTNLHPIIAKWDTEAKHTRHSSFLALNPRVSPTERRRRRILSQLFKEIEKRGGKATCLDHSKFEVIVAGENLTISSSEISKRVTVPEDKRKSSWSPWYEDVATGELRLQIEGYFKEPIRRRWRDRDKLPLEAQLREILVGLAMVAAVERRERLVREEEQRKAIEAQRRRLEFEERKRRVDVHLKELTADAEAWAKACRIRDFVDASIEAAGRLEEQSDELIAWERWARLAADAIDPLVTNVDARIFYGAELPEILRRKDEENRWRY